MHPGALGRARDADRGDLRRAARARSTWRSRRGLDLPADQGKTTASIQVTLGGGSLTDAAVRGIVSLVANAVPGLAPQNITVIDEHGNQLSSANSAIGLQTADRFAAENAFFASKTAIAQAALDQRARPRQLERRRRRPPELRPVDLVEPHVRRAARHHLRQHRDASSCSRAGRGRRRQRHGREHPRLRRRRRAARRSNYKHDVKIRHERASTRPRRRRRRRAARRPTCRSRSWSRRRPSGTAGVERRDAARGSCQNAVGYTGTVTPALNKTTVAEVNALPNAAQALKSIGVGVVRAERARRRPRGGISSMVPAPFGKPARAARRADRRSSASCSWCARP